MSIEAAPHNEGARKKVIYSGMQPTGMPTLGNYLGAMKNWADLQANYHCLYCIADLHSLTVRQDPAVLRKRARELLMIFIAVGLDPEENLVYMQSHVPAHMELTWILNCYTYVGELNRMTQFKEKSAKHADNINAGLFDYPVLMAADILLYQTDLVPIGEDQRQHLELTRDIALRLNNLYGDVFVVPEAYYGKVGARIMGLQEPEKKMSKSENDNNSIFLLDDINAVKNKIKRAVTDSGSEVVASPNKPGVTNLLNIYCATTGCTVAQAEKEFDGKGYGYFKNTVADAVAEALLPIQQRFSELNQNRDYIDTVIRTNAERANELALRTLRKVQRKVGLR